jgi:murein DD-endopeptidase MepM/ murein hydrolase activator NlpD
MGDREWLPLEGECWYAIDLLAPEGPAEVSRWRRGQRERAKLRVSAYPYEVQHITLKDDSQVTLSDENRRRVQEENRKIGALWGLQTERRFELPLGSPLADLPQGGRFGARRFFNNQPRSPHTGADYKADSGTPVLSIGAGTIALTGDFFFPGKSVFIDHGDGLISMYFHLSGIAVQEGDRVDLGEIIGLVGQSGRATGPHLHVGVRWHGARIDPRLLYDTSIAVPSLP